MTELCRPGGHRPCPLCHLRRRRPQLRPAVRAAACAETQVVQLRLQRPIGQLSASCATNCWPTPTTIWPATPTPKSSCTTSAASCRATSGRRWSKCFRNIARRFDGAYNLVFLNALGDMFVARDPLGHPAALLCQGRPAVRRGQRERGPAESGLRAESIKSLLPGQASSSPAAGWRCRRFARSPRQCALLLRVDLFRQRGQHDGRPQRLSVAQAAGRGAGPAGNACRSTPTRSSFRCPTRARPRPTPWPSSSRSRRSKG